MGKIPDPQRVRWRVEWRDEERRSHSETFNSRLIMDELIATLKKRRLWYRIITL